MNARRTVLLALALTGSICAFAAGAAANTFTVAPLTFVSGRVLLPAARPGLHREASCIQMQRRSPGST